MPKLRTIRSHHYLYLVTLLAALPYSSLRATEAAPIVVTASRTAEIADEALAPVIVIDRETIEASQAGDVADLLRFYAGLDIGRNGGAGQASSLFIRGTESNHALVMIDGVKINPGTVGGAALQNISPELIERVEIVKGPRSTLYGSEAIGGVVNIITRKARPGTSIDARVGLGEDRTRNMNLGVSHGGLRWRAGARLDLHNTDGFPTRASADRDSAHDKLGLSAFAGVSLNNWDVDFSHWQSGGSTEYVDFTLAPLAQDFRNSVTALSISTVPSDAWSTTLRMSRSVDRIDQQQNADHARSRRDTLDWQNDIQVNDHHLVTAGLTLNREKARSLVFGTGFEATTDINAVFIQDNIGYGRHDAVISARHTDHEGFGGHATWNLEYGFQLTPATRVLAGIGTAFRAPDATDRFGFGGNPDLDPETSRNIEIGLRHRIDTHQNIAVSAFDNAIDDLIEVISRDGFRTFEALNVDRARIRGLEMSYTLERGPWYLRAEGIVQDPENRITGERLLRRARKSLTLNGRYQQSGYSIDAHLLLTGDRQDIDAFNFVRTTKGGYALLNLTGKIRLDREWSLSGKIENVFDKHYELVDDFNTPDRTVFIELRYHGRHGG